MESGGGGEGGRWIGVVVGRFGDHRKGRGRAEIQIWGEREGLSWKLALRGSEWQVVVSTFYLFI